jgi:hypothetical protein
MALGWLWLASPFVLIAVISRDPNMRELVAAHTGRCRAVGSAGVAAMFLGVALLPDELGSMLFGIGTPLTGLLVWTRRDDGDDGGEERPPDLPPDWGDFERSFWDYVSGAHRAASRPRARTPR